MKSAANGLGVPALQGHQHGGSVSAGVQVACNLTVAQANHKDGLSANRGAEIVAMVFDLRLMCNVNPRLLKDVLHLKLKNLFIGVDGSVDFEAILAIDDQLIERFGIHVLVEV